MAILLHNVLELALFNFTSIHFIVILWQALVFCGRFKSEVLGWDRIAVLNRRQYKLGGLLKLSQLLAKGKYFIFVRKT